MLRWLLISGLVCQCLTICLIFMGILLKLIPLILVGVVIAFLVLIFIVIGVLTLPPDVIPNIPDYVPGWLTPAQRVPQQHHGPSTARNVAPASSRPVLGVR
uniref:Uncharacterized protein n=1 Tax=Plumleaf crab apple waikavirus TaxID=3115793 RepID=A0AAT9JHD8_9SECO